MLKLGQEYEPVWLTLIYDVRVKVRPLTAALFQTALAYGKAKIAELGEHQKAIEEAGGMVEELPDLTSRAAQEGLAQVEFSTALAVEAVLEWQNVIGPDDKLAPLTEANIREAWSDALINDDFYRKFVTQHAVRVAEGNSLGAVLNGTSAAAPTIAKAASPKAKPARKGRKGATARSAHT